MKNDVPRPILHTLVCSTRPSRAGLPVARWAQDFAQEHGKFDSTLVDLAAFGLPVFDEPEHPRFGRYQHAHTKAWSASVQAADAFIFVMPEYNHAPPSALLNALTYLSQEWQHKAIGFVSYGGFSGGIRAVQVMKQLLPTLKVVPMLEAVAVPNFTQQIAPDGRFVPTDMHVASAQAMLDELHRWTSALAALRAPATNPT